MSVDTLPAGTSTDTDRALPLSAAQHELWLSYCLQPATPTLSTAGYVEIAAPVSTERLVQAIRVVHAATESTRLSLGQTDGRPWQRVRPAGPVDVAVFAAPVDVDRAGAIERASRWMRAELARPARLDSGADPVPGELADPVYGSAVFELPGGDVLWYQRISHLAADGYAVEQLLQRVAETYTGLAAGTPPVEFSASRLPDVLAEDAAYAAGYRPARDRRYWTELLRDVPPAPGLAPTPAVPGAPWASAPVSVSVPPATIRVAGELPAAGFAAVRAVADQAGTSWPDLLLALQAIYLRRLGSAVPVLGLALMNRLGSVAAGVPVSAVNIAALPLAVDGELSVAGAARLADRQRRTAGRHRNYRYEQLRRDLHRQAPQRLFDVLVDIAGFGAPLDFAGSTARSHTLSTGPVEDLLFSFVPVDSSDGQALRVEVAANPVHHRAEDARGHLARLLHLLGPGLPAADAPIRTVGVLPPAERETVLRRWNDTAHPVPRTTLTRLLDEQAGRSPEAVAVRFGDRTLTYRELSVQADRVARELIAAGAGPGGLVGIALPRSPELVVGLLAILRTGAAYLPIDTDHPRERVAFLVDDARPACLIEPFAGAVAGEHPRRFSIDLTTEPAAAGPITDHERIRPLTPADAAYVIYTSGSTGRPKGVVVEHRAIVNRLLWMQDRYRLDGTDRVLQKTPAGFDVSVWEFFWPLLTGAELVLAVPGGHQDPSYLASLIEQAGITTLHFVPSMLRAFLDDPALDDPALGSLRRVMCSGEALPPELVAAFRRRLPHAELHNLYGPTEAAIDVTAWQCGAAEAAGEVPIGRPVWNTRLYVLDADRQPVPPGTTGELYLAGAQLARGYLNRPELTGQRFVADPFDADGGRMYRTGDLARWRPDGAMRYLGRTDDQVKLRGVRIEPGEIEAALLRLPGVAQAVVLPHDDPDRGPCLVGYLVPEPPVEKEAHPAAHPALPPDPAELRRQLAAELPSQLVPAALVVLESIPLTINGKLDRSWLAGLARTALGAAPAGTRLDGLDGLDGLPSTPRAELLCRLFAEQLGRDLLGMDEHFFEAGGHSLLAIGLARRVSAALGIEISVGSVFAAPTPRLLAAELDRAGSGPEAAIQPVLTLRRTPGLPLWCVHPAGGLGWCYAGLLPVLPSSTAVHVLQAPHLAAAGTSTAGAPMADMAEVVADYCRRILDLQPTGPYQLLGWSVGGVIAHALAVELTARGHQVSLLSLLDAYPADQWRDLELPREADALRALLHIAGIDPQQVAGLDRPTVTATLRAAGSALSTLDDAVLDAMVDVVVANNRLMHQHRHRVLAAGMLFFAAGAPRTEDWLDRRGWLPYLTGSFEEVELPCTHPGMMTGEMLAVIGAEVSRRLR